MQSLFSLKITLKNRWYRPKNSALGLIRRN